MHVRTAVQLLCYRVSHGHTSVPAHRLDAGFAATVAETMQALATPSRLRILGRLSIGPCHVGELAAEIGMQPAAVSQQLRVLRHLGLVVGRRQGRLVTYDLYDAHVGQLLDEAVSHVEHLRNGHARRSVAETPAAVAR